MEKVLMVGTGDVGTHILEFLARDPRPIHLIVGDINEERGQKLVNNAIFGATHFDLHPKFEFRKIDLTNAEQISELIKKEKPSVCINSTVLHTWHLIRQLPEDIYARLSSATLGAWLPCQLALAYNFAKAIKMSDIKTHFINTSLSCLTNPVLGKVGMAPTIGIGNIDMIEPAVRTLVARELDVPRSNLRLYMVCHHQHWVYPREAGYKPGAPYFMKITLNGKDITSQFDTDKLMYDAVKAYPPGLEFTKVSASSTIKNLMALLFDTGMYCHSPGPNGLPGGYPVRLSAKGAEVILPDELTLEEAVKMNEESGRLDGIERIEEDGTVVFTDYAVEIMREILKFDCPTFKPEDSYDLALEMMRKYKELAEKYIKIG